MKFARILKLNIVDTPMKCVVQNVIVHPRSGKRAIEKKKKKETEILLNELERWAEIRKN